ncbi:DUF4835 family protein [Pontibacter sp. HSC-14F20]|uniref:type IX secretion system protein PorD n=1 Tax=Pontibacter sp. HSC-14F20 TaxID=2864136 RepID=UPI001C738128|nr:DUF4835 family protein [Pontibacter sp. HSC-14F20]MBX0332791.1 DUF4835 family protein [Pontibacter sp. HSC-14F20]
MFKRLFVLLCVMGIALGARAQELQCDVVVNSEQVAFADRQLFTEMQNRIFEFMNNRRWTNQSYRVDERIKCRILINLTEMPEVGTFRANVQVVSVRPAYGTGYESTLFSFIDRDWLFQFNEAQPLDFAENNFTGNLSAMLAFYAYMIIGMDNDSFSKLGGSPSFDRARGILNLAASQNSIFPGWRPFEGNRNRYWMIDNMQDPVFIPFREGIYAMHREGMDIMVQDPEKARKATLEVLRNIQKISQQKPGAAVIRSFFEAKSDELVHVFKTAAPADKQAAYTLLTQVDPTNNTKYEVLLQR